MSFSQLKGNAAELLYQKWLLYNGWTVHRAEASRRGQFASTNDIFGVFDTFSFRKLRGKWEVQAAQLTVQSGRSQRRLKILNLAPFPLNWEVLVVTHEKYSGKEYDKSDHGDFWRVQRLLQGKWREDEWIKFNRKEVESYTLAEYLE